MGDIRTVPVPLPTPEGRQFVEARIVAKAKAVVEADATLGPKGDAREDWQCRYCLYKAACPDKRKPAPKKKKVSSDQYPVFSLGANYPQLIPAH